MFGLFNRKKNRDLIKCLSEELKFKVRCDLEKAIAMELKKNYYKNRGYFSYDQVRRSAIDKASDKLASDIVDEYKEKILTSCLTDGVVQDAVRSKIHNKLKDII